MSEYHKRFLEALTRFVAPRPVVRQGGRGRPAGYRASKTKAVLKRRRRNELARISRRVNRGK